MERENVQSITIFKLAGGFIQNISVNIMVHNSGLKVEGLTEQKKLLKFKTRITPS